jgi:hypothetical protein
MQRVLILCSVSSVTENLPHSPPEFDFLQTSKIIVLKHTFCLNIIFQLLSVWHLLDLLGCDAVMCVTHSG